MSSRQVFLCHSAHIHFIFNKLKNPPARNFRTMGIRKWFSLRASLTFKLTKNISRWQSGTVKSEKNGNLIKMSVLGFIRARETV